MAGAVAGLLAALGGVTVINPINITDIGDVEFDPTNPSASIQIDRAGTITVSGNTTTAGAAWCSPSGGTPGDTKWVRLTVTAGTNPNGGSTVSVWHQLSSNIGWVWSRSTLGTTSATVTIEIAAESDGTPVLATKTGIVVTVTKDI